MADFTFHISLNGTEIRTITNFNKDLTRDTVPEFGYIMRKKLEGNIVCQGADYNWFEDQKEGANKFSIFDIEIKKDGVNYWNGNFSMTKANLDINKVTFKPIVKDGYSELLKNWENKVDVLSGVRISFVSYDLKSILEFAHFSDQLVHDGWELISGVPRYTWSFIEEKYVAFGTIKIYAREKLITTDIGNVTGAWGPLGDDTYVREPIHNYPELTIGTVIFITNPPGANPNNLTIGLPSGFDTNVLMYTHDFNGDIIEELIQVTDAVPLTKYFNPVYKHGISFQRFFDSLVQKTDTINNYTVKSDFFSDANNYVSGAGNILLNTFFLPNINFKTQNIDDTSTIRISLKEFWDSFNAQFKNNLIWFIDNQGFFRIEHKEFLSFNVGYSLEDVTPKPYKNKTYSTRNESIMYNRELLTMSDSSSVDWNDLSLIYDIPILDGSKENVIEYNSSLITTDLDHMLTSTDFNESGFLMIATDLSFNVYTVRKSAGYINGEQIQNEIFSLIRLHFFFNRTEMPISQYIFETGDLSLGNTAQTLSRSINQQTLTYVKTDEVDFFDSIETDLGNGITASFKRNIYTDKITHELIYR